MNSLVLRSPCPMGERQSRPVGSNSWSKHQMSFPSKRRFIVTNILFEWKGTFDAWMKNLKQMFQTIFAGCGGLEIETIHEPPTLDEGILYILTQYK